MSNAKDVRKFFIDREYRRIEITHGNISTRFPLNPIPDDLFQAMLQKTDYGDDVKETLGELRRSRIFEGTICTYRTDSMFPVNAAIKIVFLTPLDSVIEDSIDDIESAILSFQGKPFLDTLEERFELFRNIYLDESKIDRFRLGAIEMYGELTYKNLLQDPRAALLFRWNKGSVSKSVQLNTLAEIASPNEPYFRFLRAIRALFAERFLDLLDQSHFCAYRFWICERISKDLADRTGFPKV